MHLPHTDFAFCIKAMPNGKIAEQWSADNDMALFTSISTLDVSRKHNCDMNIEDVTIDDDTFLLLSMDHMFLLKGKEFLQKIDAKLES